MSDPVKIAKETFIKEHIVNLFKKGISKKDLQKLRLYLIITTLTF